MQVGVSEENPNKLGQWPDKLGVAEFILSSVLRGHVYCRLGDQDWPDLSTMA